MALKEAWPARILLAQIHCMPFPVEGLTLWATFPRPSGQLAWGRFGQWEPQMEIGWQEEKRSQVLSPLVLPQPGPLSIPGPPPCDPPS